MASLVITHRSGQFNSFRVGLPEHFGPRMEPEVKTLPFSDQQACGPNYGQRLEENGGLFSEVRVFLGLAEDLISLVSYALIFIKFKLAPNSLVCTFLPLC